MKFCFGTFAKILLLCGVENIEKRKLLNALVKSVDPSCNLTSNAVTTLLQCTSNLPDGRSNSLGNVISNAENSNPQKVADYFADKIVIKMLDYNKRKLAVLAIRELIAKDDSISEDTIVEKVNGKTKNALLMQSKFALSQFLAGVFLIRRAKQRTA